MECATSGFLECAVRGTHATPVNKKVEGVVEEYCSFALLLLSIFCLHLLSLKCKPLFTEC